MPRLDLSGQRFGRLTAKSPRSTRENGRTTLFWECVCDCGNAKVIRGSELRAGKSKSCGCLQRDLARASHLVHGESGETTTRTYSIWKSMRCRCASATVKNYGARGIRCCDRWSSYTNFLQDMGYCPDKLTLERIDNDGHYEPENCKWATRRENVNNRRVTLRIKVYGNDLPLADAARLYGVRYTTLHKRIFEQGWTPEVAVSR